LHFSLGSNILKTIEVGEADGASEKAETGNGNKEKAGFFEVG
jgi:hypothetical protein